MKIPLKYGLLAALGFILWVLVAHTLTADTRSPIHTLTPVVSNVLHFVMIFLGIKALERERGERLSFKDALKTGVSIAFVFALTTVLFFVCVVSFIGDKWLAIEPGAANMEPRTLMVLAFAGLFLGTLIFGLLYSAVISFFVAKRRSQET